MCIRHRHPECLRDHAHGHCGRMRRLRRRDDGGGQAVTMRGEAAEAGAVLGEGHSSPVQAQQ